MMTAVVAGLLALLTLGATPAVAQSDVITGAGATFPYPLYSRWASDYNAKTGVKLNYQAIGSGGGIAQIKAGTVDFGASDEPLESAELMKAGLVQFPMIMGGVVPVVNIPGVKANDLKLPPDVLADIFLGKIKKWNDARITAANPGVTLPNLATTVVHRADGSGTTWIFTNYLSKVSADWKSQVGNDKTVSWPVGIGGKGNPGVAAFVEKTKGSIGYVEYAYAMQKKNLATVQLQSQAGNFVTPDADSFKSAAANADWKSAKNYYVVLTNQPGKNSWPITGASFILMHKDQKDAAKARQVLKFFHWCYENGEKAALDLHYVPMPANVVKMVEQTWKDDITSGGKAVWK
jgi:phosphate transport system substrate-binding protein